MPITQDRRRSGLIISELGRHAEILPEVASWIYREWSFLYIGKTRSSVENMLRERLNTRKLPLTLVAFLDREPVGTVSLKEFEMPERPELRPWVASLYVIPAARNRGVGSDLMRAAEQKASGMGFPRLFLFTADPRLASRFYAPLGWRVKETIRYHAYPVIIMERAAR